MSRIGKQPINLPNGVSISIEADHIIVSGSKGSLTQFTMPDIKVEQIDHQVIVSRANDESSARAKHGLMRSLLNNMISGVSDGFSKKLEINGVGYRVALQSQATELKLNLGFSHDVIYNLPVGITATIEQNTITISGIDKQKVGQVAAEIRNLKKPEPYKGKGIKYEGERIIRKSGKSGKDK